MTRNECSFASSESSIVSCLPLCHRIHNTPYQALLSERCIFSIMPRIPTLRRHFTPKILCSRNARPIRRNLIPSAIGLVNPDPIGTRSPFPFGWVAATAAARFVDSDAVRLRLGGVFFDGGVGRDGDREERGDEEGFG